MSCAGFTLLELVIVVLVLGILVTLATPMLATATREVRLDAATAEVVAALAFARNAAAGSQTQAKITFDAGNETVAVLLLDISKTVQELNKGKDEANANQMEDDGTFRAPPHPLNPDADYTVDLGAGSVLGPVDVVSASFGGATEVTFYPTGVVSAGGAAVIARGGMQRTINVDALTGQVTVN